MAEKRLSCLTAISIFLMPIRSVLHPFVTGQIAAELQARETVPRKKEDSNSIAIVLWISAPK